MCQWEQRKAWAISNLGHDGRRGACLNWLANLPENKGREKNKVFGLSTKKTAKVLDKYIDGRGGYVSIAYTRESCHQPQINLIRRPAGQ